MRQNLKSKSQKLERVAARPLAGSVCSHPTHLNDVLCHAAIGSVCSLRATNPPFSLCGLHCSFWSRGQCAKISVSRSVGCAVANQKTAPVRRRRRPLPASNLRPTRRLRAARF